MPVPQLSVIMSVYNGEEHLEESIESVLTQSFEDFEFIIVDDASTDKTEKILHELAAKDPRLHIIKNKVNMERSASRNKAIENARAPFIAVMDADDVASPNRFKIQLDFMRNNPHIAACGGAIEIYETGQICIPPSKFCLKISLLFGNRIYHPTTMLQKAAFQAVGGYSLQFPPVEDYDLWIRLLVAGYELDNIPDVLLKYRTHPSIPRTEYRLHQRELLTSIYCRQLANIDITPTRHELALHRLCEAPKPETAMVLNSIQKWLTKIAHANSHVGRYDPEQLNRFLQEMTRSFVIIRFAQHPVLWIIRHVRYFFSYICSFAGKKGAFFEQHTIVAIWKLRALSKRGHFR